MLIDILIYCLLLELRGEKKSTIDKDKKKEKTRQQIVQACLAAVDKSTKCSKSKSKERCEYQTILHNGVLWRSRTTQNDVRMVASEGEFLIELAPRIEETIPLGRQNQLRRGGISATEFEKRHFCKVFKKYMQLRRLDDYHLF